MQTALKEHKPVSCLYNCFDIADHVTCFHRPFGKLLSISVYRTPLPLASMTVSAVVVEALSAADEDEGALQR
jgi:hypothetical protein